MTGKLKGNHKLTAKSRRFVAKVAEELTQQVMIDGLKQFTDDGIIEAKWKIAGIANLVQRLGEEDWAKSLVQVANHMNALLNSQNARAEVWQNLREAIENDADDQ